MYEDTKNSIDWKGIFLKVIIAFLIVIIAVKGYTTLKGNNDKKINTTTETVAETKDSSTFATNIEKLRNAGEKYFTDNKDNLPKTEGTSSMVTLNELIKKGDITRLTDDEGKTCDGESSYVTASIEGTKTKIKANLVCGSASSYSLVYMGENDSETKKEEVVKTNNSTTNYTYKTETKKTNTTNKTTSCGNSCTPSVTVNTKVENKVSINKDTTNKTEETNKKPVVNNTTNNKVDKYYTVSFDSNGGDRHYSSQDVKAYNTAYNPGNTYKSGFTFNGWYLNGVKYDFSTPVTRNITLVANYTKNYNNDYEYDYDYDYDYSTPKTTTTTVYTMGWDFANVDSVTVKHTLQLPSSLYGAEMVRIKKITYSQAINTPSLANTYKNKHASTFFYASNGWESDTRTKNSLATISGAKFNYDNSYKYTEDALTEGFDVTWTSTRISKYCSVPFTVKNGNEYVNNVCNYGIVYKVTWEYIK